MQEIGADFREHVPPEKIAALRTRLGAVDPAVKDQFFSVSPTEESSSEVEE